MRYINHLLVLFVLVSGLSMVHMTQGHMSPAIGGAVEENWVSIGPPGVPLSNNDIVSGQVNAIAVHPSDSKILYIGAAEGGVWKTVDGGSTWKPLTDFQLVREVPVGGGRFVSKATQSIGSLAIDPSNPDVVYAGTGDPNQACCFYGADLGVFRSNDGGNTWAPLGSIFRPGCADNGTMSNARVNKIIVRPGAPTEVFAATTAGLFKYKEDGADCWKRLTDGLPASGSAIDLVRDTVGGDFYVAFDSTGIFKTTDTTGEKWKQLTTGLPSSGLGRIALAISPSQHDVLYAGFNVGGQYRLFKSMDRGVAWGMLPNPPSDAQLHFNNAIAVSPRSSDFVYVGQVDLWRATDGGRKGGLNDYRATPPVTGNSWTTLSCCLSDSNPFRRGLDLHADLHDIVFAPKGSFVESTSSAEIVFVVNDGGVTKGTINDVGVVDWQSLTLGLTLGQFGTIGLSPSNVNEVLGGFWHNGNAFTPNAGLSWDRFGIGGGGDGFQASIDAARPVTMHGDKVTVMYVNTNAFSGGAITRVRADFGHVIPIIVQEQIWSNNSTVVHWSDPYRDGDLLRLQGGRIFRAHGASTRDAADLNTDAAWEIIDPPGKSGDTATMAFERRLGIDDKPAYYLGTTTGQIWHGSPDVGWEKVCDCGGMFDNKKHEIAIDLSNPNRIVAVFQGSSSPGRIKEVTRLPGGAWTSKNIDDRFSPPLQIERVYTVVVDPLDSNTVFAGTDQGAYRGRLESGDWVWTRSPGIPNVSVTDFEAHQRFIGGLTGTVRAGTYGRGIFELERTITILNLDCPADVTVTAPPGQSSVVVNYPPPVVNNPASTVVLSSPPSGSLFPAGATTVSVTAIDSSGSISTCTFTVTVNLANSSLALICPGEVRVVVPTGQTSAVVDYPPPSLNKNEPATSVCSPPSGSSFPVGTTIVACTANNTLGETAACSFAVNVIEQPSIDVCLQDDSSGNILKFNSPTGVYQFTVCNGVTLSGTGIVTIHGGVITLQDYASDHRVLASVDTTVKKGTAAIQLFSPATTFTIADRNIENNSCACP